jgi:hypothetical protein
MLPIQFQLSKTNEREEKQEKETKKKEGKQNEEKVGRPPTFQEEQ